MLQQALFTSVRGSRVEGYHLAATSAGLDEAETRELARWGPAHESLLDASEDASSVNFVRLESGRFAVSLTATAGEEYSGRGGRSVVSNFLVCDDEMLRRFASNPFRLLDAALALGWPATFTAVPEELPPLALAGRASPVETQLLAQMSAEIGSSSLAKLVDAALQLDLDSSQPGILALSGSVSAELLIRALFSLLPLDVRAKFSFTSGLRFSSTRPFRIQPLPHDHAEQKKFLRQSGAELFDIAAKGGEPVQHEWAKLVARALREQRLHWFAREVSHVLSP